jgi:FkbM family methyltransferase
MRRQVQIFRNRVQGYAVVDSVRLPIDRSLISPRIERALAAGHYEREETILARDLVRPGDAVLELGAGLGLVSTVVRRFTEAGRIVCYEANPHLIPYICSAHALNGARDIDVRHAVVLPNPLTQTVPFYLCDEFWSSSLCPSSNAHEVSVRTERLSDVIAEIKPDVLLMDIEGGEADVLETDDLGAIREIAIELHGGATEERALASLKRHGFIPRCEPMGTVHAFTRLPSL